jgi:hypothetical protein
VLVGVDDVEAGVGEEAADRGDQARPVRAGEQQARCGVLGDARIMPGARQAVPDAPLQRPRGGIIEW